MATLDTNVLVRWLVVDDEVQAEVVAGLLASCAERNERLYVPLTVMLELEWVLRSRYRFEKASVLAALDGLMSASELAFQEEAALERQGMAAIIDDHDTHRPLVALGFTAGGGEDLADFGLSEDGFAFHRDSPLSGEGRAASTSSIQCRTAVRLAPSRWDWQPMLAVTITSG